MNRVLFVSLDEGAVMKRCTAANVGISALESLPAGGTRLVCMSSDGAATMRKKLKAYLIAGDPERERFRPAKPLW